MSSPEALARPAGAAAAAAGLGEELRSAIGLAWGLVDTGAFDQALTLCDGCLRLWPDCAELQLLRRMAAIETGAALAEPEPTTIAQRTPWRTLLSVLRRRLGLP